MSLLEPSLFATTWNAQTLRETASFVVTPELTSFARRVVEAPERDVDLASRLETIDAAVRILGDSLTDSDAQNVTREVERLRSGDSYRVSESSETSAYATLLAARVLARIDRPLPVSVSERLVSEFSDLRRDYSLAEIDKTGIPTLLPLIFARQSALPPSSRAEARALISAWDETISNDPVNGLTMAMRVLLREAHLDGELTTAPVDLGALKASDGGYALSPGGSFDPKATFLAVALGARLDERDIARVRTGMAASGWLHVGEPDVHSTYLATEIVSRCGREPADSTGLIEEITTNGLADVTIQDVFELCSRTEGEDVARASLGPTIGALRSLEPSNVSESSQLAVTARACGVEFADTSDSAHTGQTTSLDVLQEAALGRLTHRRSLVASSRKTLATLQAEGGWSFAPGEEVDPLSTLIGKALDPQHAPRDRDERMGFERAPDLALVLASLSTPKDLGPLYPLIFFG